MTFPYLNKYKQMFLCQCHQDNEHPSLSSQCGRPEAELEGHAAQVCFGTTSCHNCTTSCIHKFCHRRKKCQFSNLSFRGQEKLTERKRVRSLETKCFEEPRALYVWCGEDNTKGLIYDSHLQVSEEVSAEGERTCSWRWQRMDSHISGMMWLFALLD